MRYRSLALLALSLSLPLAADVPPEPVGIRVEGSGNQVHLEGGSASVSLGPTADGRRTLWVDGKDVLEGCPELNALVALGTRAPLAGGRRLTLTAIVFDREWPWASGRPLSLDFFGPGAEIDVQLRDGDETLLYRGYGRRGSVAARLRGESLAQLRLDLPGREALCLKSAALPAKAATPPAKKADGNERKNDEERR